MGISFRDLNIIPTDSDVKRNTSPSVSFTLACWVIV
jgi:hypothetical protein